LHLLALTGASAQNGHVDRLLESVSPVPEEFRTLSSVKYADERQRSGNGSGRQDDFLLESSFMVDQVLNSGKVLFNDPVSLYLNAVMDRVLHDRPDLRAKVRVYAMRSAAVNAFTTNNGIILFNLGLMAQLETEAQVAFVLCHELEHWIGGHVMSSYIEAQDIADGRGSYSQAAISDRLLAQSRYNKDLELVADSLGLIRLGRAGYSLASVADVFEVMRYAHIPFDDIPWRQDQYDQGPFKIDPGYYLSKVRTIDPLTDMDPASTHPATAERLDKALSQLGHAATGVEFKDAREDFATVRDLARNELVAVANHDRDPIKALYLAYLLSHGNEAGTYMRHQKAKAFYSLLKFKNGGSFGSVHPGWSQVQGESQQLYHLFYRLQADELNVLAVRELYRLWLEEPDQPDLRLMFADAVADLIAHHAMNGVFERNLPSAARNGDTTGTVGRFGRIQRKALDDPRKWMVQYGLVDLFAQPTFASVYDSILEYRAKHPPVAPEIRAERRKADRLRDHGFGIGAQKAVCVSPEYIKFDMRKRQNNRFMRSEEARMDLQERIMRSAKATGLDLVLLDRTRLGTDDVQAFNDITFLNDWVDARFAETEVGMVNTESERLNGIMEHYGTEHFVWTGVVNYRETKPLRFFYLLYLLMPPALPLALYNIISPSYDTYYFFVVFDLRTGEPEMVAYSNFNQRDAGDVINSKVYDSFYQLRRSPRKADMP
jgi:Zn-dependent protease with chaperone function